MAEDVETPGAVIDGGIAKELPAERCGARKALRTRSNAVTGSPVLLRNFSASGGSSSLRKPMTLGKLARLPKARRHEQHHTGTLSGHRRGEAGALACQRSGRRSIPALTRKSSNHFALSSAKPFVFNVPISSNILCGDVRCWRSCGHSPRSPAGPPMTHSRRHEDANTGSASGLGVVIVS